ncbi:hypothetical protein Tsubulata_039829 [Turnera subulata]|uniref:Pentacotripeptide-repeat region of PRORP domain-containing protein n=1 Tax=Turnera subulata TaxID=218843 RepID=A0A9Q0G1Z5_9ROSI|nr:hypothetical protein Tsubulata_039829 [Turnera subulata]
MEISKLSRNTSHLLKHLLNSVLYPISHPPIPSLGSILFSPVTHPSSHPHCYTSFCTVSSSGFSSDCSTTYNPSAQYSKVLSFSGLTRGCRRQSLNPYFVITCNRSWFRRSYSSSSFDVYPNSKMGVVNGFRRRQIPSQIHAIINLVRCNGDDMETRLASLNVKLSISSVEVVFRVLNREKASTLRFFRWFNRWQPELGRNSDFCSLMINNCGILNDYDAMRCLLVEFSGNRICLTAKAFEFLSVTPVSKDMMTESTERVVNLLREIGGSCYGSGVYSLVDMFSVLGSFDMAEFVIRTTDRKVSYYTVLIREMCRKRDFKGAIAIPDVMRREGCNPSSQTYNFLISNLLKNGESSDAFQVFDEMLQKGCPPDALTFEIFIYHYCRLGEVASAFKLLDEMVAKGLTPRLLTHAAFIKGFFNAHQYEKAYEYVVGSSDLYSISANYSLLASLHRKGGNPVVAQNILSEMIKKGLRPNFMLYRKVVKHLSKTGREEFATELEEQFFQLENP